MNIMNPFTSLSYDLFSLVFEEEFPIDLLIYIIEEDRNIHEKRPRKFVHENYVDGHTIPVAKKVESLFYPNFQLGAYCVGRGHDILESLLGKEKLLEKRKNFENNLLDYGRWGEIVYQSLNLLDFKYFMQNYSDEKGIKLKIEKGSKRSRARIKNKNYKHLMDSLLGNNGDMYFENFRPNPLSLLYARVTKLVDLGENLDFNKESKLDLSKDDEEKRRKQLIRNSLRIWKYSDICLEKILNIENHNLILKENSLRFLIDENKTNSIKIIKNNGDFRDKNELYILQLNSILNHFF